MNVDELIQLIRTCNAHQVRAELQKLKHKQGQGVRSSGDLYYAVALFYQRASRQPK